MIGKHKVGLLITATLISVLYLCNRSIQLPVFVVDSTSYSATNNNNTPTATNDSNLLENNQIVNIDEDDQSEEEGWWKSSFLSTNNSTTTKMLISPDELAKDVQPAHLCGIFKCYFPSINHPGYGYLFAKQRRHGANKTAPITLDEQTQALRMTFDLASELETKYGFENLMMTHFTWIIPTKVLIDKFNERPDPRLPNTGHKGFTNDRVGSGLFVQVVKTAPTPNLILKLKKKKGEIELTEEYLELMNTFFFKSNITFTPEFKTNVLKGWDSTLELLKAKPDLLHDFQFMVDCKGNMYHMDLDRMYLDLWTGGFDINDIKSKLIDVLLNYFERAMSEQQLSQY